MPWNADGVRGEDQFLRLLYNAPAEALIAYFQRTVGPGYPIGSFYVKRPHDEQYWKAFASDDMTTVAEIVSASKVPLVFFQVLVVAKPLAADASIGLNWSQVGRIDLSTKEQSIAVDAELFRERHDGDYVSHVIGASEDGTSLICSIVTRRPAPPNRNKNPTRRVAGHSLCRLDLTTLDFDVLARLTNTFF
jgi:hypothetical protein